VGIGPTEGPTAPRCEGNQRRAAGYGDATDKVATAGQRSETETAGSRGPIERNAPESAATVERAATVVVVERAATVGRATTEGSRKYK
jgi:hypothetical protein